MKIYNLKKMSVPKVAVLATGLAAAVLVVTVNPPPAQAFPGQTSACTGCHSAGGSVSATPSSAALAPGAAYTVALAFTGGAGGSVGYWISGEGGNVTGSSTSAAMTAPAVAGTYSYTVWMRDEAAASTTYSITVGVTPEPTATTTTPEPTVTTTTPEPTVTTTTPEPTVTTTTPEPTVTTTAPEPTTTTPPVASDAKITSLSPDHGVVGSSVRIKGSGFAPGTVKFGSVTAVVTSWSSTSIIIKVPAINSVTIGSDARPFWYRSGQRVAVTVNPTSAEASNAASFFVHSRKGHHDSNRDRG